MRYRDSYHFQDWKEYAFGTKVGSSLAPSLWICSGYIFSDRFFQTLGFFHKFAFDLLGSLWQGLYKRSGSNKMRMKPFSWHLNLSSIIQTCLFAFHYHFIISNVVSFISRLSFSPSFSPKSGKRPRITEKIFLFKILGVFRSHTKNY